MESRTEEREGKEERADLRDFDVAIVGGGYAGLSAALLLGHYIVPTVIFDFGPTRNSTTEHVHGYLGMDGISPSTFLTIAWKDVLKFTSVRLVKGNVVSAARRESSPPGSSGDVFHLTTHSGQEFDAKYVIIATGVEDVKPKIANFEKFDGRGAWHCPHCDGIEAVGKELIVISTPENAVEYAKEFLGWTREITLFVVEETHSPDQGEIHATELLGSGISRETRKKAERLGIRVIEGETITEILPGENGLPRAVRCESGRTFDAQILFYHLGFKIRNEIAKQLGCKLDAGFVKVSNSRKETSVKRVYAAGDIDTDKHYVVLAAAAGALAAFSIHESILKERFSRLR